jgi:hypothetical protein
MNTEHKYFTLEELTKSNTALAYAIDNTPPASCVENLHRLMDYLDLVREAYGKPIRVSSGYRCPQLNALVGGVSSSQHKQGLAADLVVPDLEHLMDVIRKLGGFDQLIDERPGGGSRWVHVSIAQEGGKPRGDILLYNGRGYKRIK